MRPEFSGISFSTVIVVCDSAHIIAQACPCSSNVYQEIKIDEFVHGTMKLKARRRDLDLILTLSRCKVLPVCLPGG